MRLVTFPGQGTPISIPVLQELINNRSKQFRKIVLAEPTIEKLIDYILKNPSNPGSIAVCSNIYYRLFETLCEEQPIELLSAGKTTSPHFLLGHSLGELTCLSLNRLFSPTDLLNIANFRNDLMVRYTREYCKTHSINSKFEMYAITSSSSIETQVNDLINSIRSTAPTLNIANINSPSQCVITGQPNDINQFKTKLQQLSNTKLRITKLSNPYGIPFHNNTILKPIQEPLYDYICDTLRQNGTHTRTRLDYPIISNLDGTVTSDVQTAIEKFVQCSSNTVQFTKCCDTVLSKVKKKNTVVDASHQDDNKRRCDEKENSIAVCMGPGEVIYNLLRRNCKPVRCYAYSSLESVNKFHEGMM